MCPARLAAALLCWLVLAPSAGAQVTYSITYVDPDGLSTPQDQARMTAAIRATGADWARYFQTPGPINLTVELTMTTAVPRATGRSGSSWYYNTQNNINVFEQAASTKVRTGSPSIQPADILLEMNPTYLTQNLWFESNHTTRTEQIPVGRTDAYAVFVHELGHAFYHNGWRNPDGTLTTPPSPTLSYQSTWDRWITPEGNGVTLFRGPNAMEVYGGPVPVTNDNPNHYGNSAASGLPGSNLVPGPSNGAMVGGLMNGVVFHFQTRYSISALDLAIAKDSGMVLAPFRWTGTSGNWTTATNWNFDPDAGPNFVVPAWSAFDARIDRVTGSPYSVGLGQPVAVGAFTLASPDATLVHTAAPFTVTTGDLAAGVYLVNGGTVNGGTWTSGGGTMRFSTNPANEIRGATLGAGVLDLTTPTGSYVRFTNGTTFATPAAGATLGPTTGPPAVLALDQPTLSRGTLNLAGGVVAIEGNRSVTLGPDVTIGVGTAGQTGFVGQSGSIAGIGHLGNQGVLQATAANATLTINPSGTFNNTGTIRTTVPTARVNVQAGELFTNTGTVRARGSVAGNVANTAGSLRLNGTIGGALSVSGGVVGAGPEGPGTLTVGSAFFRPGGAFEWQVNDWAAGAAAGVGHDQLTGGTLDLTQLVAPGQFTIRVVGLTGSNTVGAVPGFDPFVSRSWVIADFTNDLTGTPANRFALDTTQFTSANNLNGGTFGLNLTDTGEVVLTFTPVPEPALVFGLAALGLGGFRALRTRRQRAGRSRNTTSSPQHTHAPGWFPLI